MARETLRSRSLPSSGVAEGLVGLLLDVGAEWVGGWWGIGAGGSDASLLGPRSAGWKLEGGARAGEKCEVSYAGVRGCEGPLGGREMWMQKLD